MDESTQMLRHGLLSDLSALELICDALAIPMKNSERAAFLADFDRTCDSVGVRLDQLLGRDPEEPEDRVAPMQWMMDGGCGAAEYGATAV